MGEEMVLIINIFVHAEGLEFIEFNILANRRLVKKYYDLLGYYLTCKGKKNLSDHPLVI